jgi:hypothetical protein
MERISKKRSGYYFAQSAVMLRLNMRTDNFRKKWVVETSIRENIYKAFAVVHLVKEDGTKTS